MKKLKKLVSLLLVVVLCVTMTSTAFAKNVCVNASGNCAKTSRFTVTTGSSWITNSKITFTQTKGTISYTNNACGTSSTSTYGGYTIGVMYKQSDGRYNYSFYQWKDSKTYSIKLKKNTTYIITVTPHDVDTVFSNCRNSSWTVKARTLGTKSWMWDPEWTTNSTWSVKSTSKVNSCTINW